MRNKISYLKNLLPIIGLSLFTYIIWRTGIGRIGREILKINILYLFISLLLFFPRFLISTWKWNMIARKQGIEIPFQKLLKINLIGLFYGTITPLWIGDAIRIFYLKEESKKSTGRCASNFVIDQMIEFFSLFILSIIGSLMVLNHFPQIFLSLFPIFLLTLALALLLKNKKIGKKFMEFFYSLIIPEKFKARMKGYADEFYQNMPSLKFLVIPLFMEIFAYIIFFFQIYLIALGMGIHVALTFLFVYPIASLIGQIPITISGFGTREGMLLKLLSIYGIDAPSIIAISLTGYAVTILIPSIAGMYYSIRFKPRLEWI